MTKVVLLFVFLCTLYFTGTHAFSVSGTTILDPYGKPILLRGVDRCSLEWNPQGQYLAQSDYALMRGWGANVVRLSLNQVYWNTNYDGYIGTVDQQVAWITGLGMAVILDLHWSQGGAAEAAQQCMADANSVIFWTAVANRYKSNSWVLFELYNEPNTISWSVWLNGGPDCGFTVVGMQQLYNAVRATGANNVVIVGGLSWAYDLTGIPQYALNGTNIVYNTHPYDDSGKQPSDWEASFGFLTATYPVFASEFGQYCSGDNYVQELLQYFQTKGIHWTAWAWWVQDCSFPSLISDWNGDPLAPAGPLVKAALAGTPPIGGTSSSSSSVGSTSTTSTPTSTTTAKSSTTTGSSSGTSAQVTITTYVDNDAWYFEFDSITGTPYTTTSVEIEDSSGAGWQALTLETGVGWVIYPTSPLVAPISVRIISASGTAELDGLITSLTGGVTYTVTATYH